MPSTKPAGPALPRRMGTARGPQRGSGGGAGATTLALRRTDAGDTSPGLGAAGIEAVVGSGGRPLDDATRTFFALRLGRRLDAVRVHTDDSADRSARSLGALAYAAGEHLVFRAGAFAPGTARGRRLLAHELAHTLQQGFPPASSTQPPQYVVGKLDDPAERAAERVADAVAAGRWAPVPVAHPAAAGGTTIVRRQPGGGHPPAASTLPPPPRPAASFDPSAVDVRALTNEALLAECFRVRDWLAQHRTDEPDRSGYELLRGRLADERERRVGMGYVWLRTTAEQTPAVLIGIGRDQAGGMVVARADPSLALGPPADLGGNQFMTVNQFQGLLDAQAIPTIDLATYQRVTQRQAALTGMLGVTAGRLYLPRFGAMTEPSFAYGLHAGWLGPFAEATYGVGQPFLQSSNLNVRYWVDATGARQRGNYPVMDFGPGVLGREFASVKVSTRPNIAGRIDYFLQGHAEMLGTQPGATNLQSFLANNPGMTQADVARLSVLAINPDDMAAYRAMLRSPRGQLTPSATNLNWERVGVQRVYDGYLRASPLAVQTQAGSTATFGTFQDLHNAYRTGAISETAFFNALSRVGSTAADAVASSGLQPGFAGQLRTARTGAGDPETLRALGSGEFLSALQRGGGLRGSLLAGSEASARGGAYGGLIAVVTDAGVILWDPQSHPEWGQELLGAGGRGALAGTTAGFVEQQLGARLLAGSAFRSPATALLGGRAPVAGVGAGIGTMAIETVGILSEQREHSGEEVVLREGRAFVIGGASGYVGTAVGAATGTILTSALAGTAIGTAVPGLGNVIGFVVGLGVGIAVAYGLSQAIPEVPANIGRTEPAAQGSAAQAQQRYEEHPHGGWCFSGDTLVAMADGSAKPIGDIRVGDRVRAFDERADDLRIERVRAATGHGPRPVLRIGIEGSTRPLRVTAEHPILGGGAWIPAGALAPGRIVTLLDPEGRSFEAPVTEVTEGDVAPVYSLSVTGCSTYVADRVVVHNKAF